MSFLVMGGIAVDVEEDGASLSSPTRVGSLSPSVDGSEGGAVRAEYPVRTFRAFPMSPSEYATLAEATPADRLILCGGEALGDVTALYRVTRAMELEREGTSHLCVVTLTLEAA